MHLSNSDIHYAIECGKLIVRPRPEEFEAGYDETSIDLHLGPIAKAQVWDVEALLKSEEHRGANGLEVHLGTFRLGEFAEKFLVAPPAESSDPRCARSNWCASGDRRWLSSRVASCCGRQRSGLALRRRILS